MRLVGIGIAAALAAVVAGVVSDARGAATLPPQQLPPIADQIGIDFDDAAHNHTPEPPEGRTLLTQGVKDALALLSQNLTAEGYADVTITSGYRPQSYQQHLYDIRTAFVDLVRLGFRPKGAVVPCFNKPCHYRPHIDAPANPTATQQLYLGLKDEVNAEINAHLLVGNTPADAPRVNNPQAKPTTPDAIKNAKHTTGEAVDLDLGNTGVPGDLIDDEACRAGLWRPYPKDPVHFELIPADGKGLARLTVRVVGNATGMVTLTPDRPSYPPGCLVQIDAQPDDASTVATVTGCTTSDPCVVRMARPGRTVTVRFSQPVAHGGGVYGTYRGTLTGTTSASCIQTGEVQTWDVSGTLTATVRSDGSISGTWTAHMAPVAGSAAVASDLAFTIGTGTPLADGTHVQVFLPCDPANPGTATPFPVDSGANCSVGVPVGCTALVPPAGEIDLDGTLVAGVYSGTWTAGGQSGGGTFRLLRQ